MAFDCWNSALIQVLCKSMVQMSESHALINRANLTVVQLDPRFTHSAQQLRDVLNSQYAALAREEDVNSLGYMVHPNAQAIAASGQRWLAPGIDDKVRCNILKERVALDPLDKLGMPLTLTMRLFDGGISHSHYTELLQRAPINNGADLVSGGAWLLPIDEAITVIQAALLPVQQKQLNELIEQGRLQLISGSELGNFCVISSLGAFIRLEAEYDKVDVLALSHELGHALDLEQRWHQGSYEPIEVIEREAAAIAMEFLVLDKSQNLIHYQNDLKRTQCRFYGPWHVALHQFELGLYGMAHISPKKLDRLWLVCTGSLGSRKGGWRAIQHFYTSPFYLICYPLALGCLC